MRTTFWLSALAPLALLAGCGPQIDSATALTGDDAFVAISRPLTAQAASVRSTQSVPSGNNESFYIAISKKELGQKWFLSAFLKDYYPGTVGSGAASSLGVKVVTFRVQNGKLFVFDASDNYATSDTFDPTLIIEAYPIVDSAPGFTGVPGASNYVLFDPAAGLNRFGVLSDAFAGGSQPAHVQVDLAFMQNFRKIADGATFEQVFTGYSNDVALETAGNVFKASGTLGIALRRYAESSDYTPTDLVVNAAGSITDFYFRSAAHIIKNAGQSYQTTVKWNIHKGMKPIKWLMSDQFLKLKDDPKFAAYDIIGAVQKGVENWNAVFGFKALEAKVATAADSYADDDKNYIVYDADPTYGYAFANWRSNPNTGEVRGASVYFNGVWLTSVDVFTDDPAPGMAAPAPGPAGAAPGPVATLTWGDMRPDPLCVMWAPTTAASADEVVGSSGAVPLRTKKEKFEAYITHVINHEIGHTLGLRHNFKGSLVAPSSSVMDYIGTLDRTLLDKPQAYDYSAIQYLYGLAAAPPAQAFCTDGDVQLDPDCSRFDFGADPLNNDAGPGYAGVLAQYLKGASPTAPNNTLNRVLKWLKGPNTAQRLAAWKYAIAGLQVGVDTTANGFNPARVDVAAGRLFARLYLDTPDKRGDANNGGAFLQDPPVDAAVTPLLLTELKGNLVNSDGFRSYATRRQMVAILKKLQLTPALTALVDARKTIAAARAGMTGSDATLTDELLSRIDAATNNYFNQ
jgi:hypothetical protein